MADFPGRSAHNTDGMQHQIPDSRAELPSQRLFAEHAGEETSPTNIPDMTLPGEEAERTARSRLFDEVLAGVELVLAADGVAFWREEADHSLVLTASRSMSPEVLATLDREVVAALQSIMQRWPDSPLVAVPLEDAANPIAEEVRALAQQEGIVGLAGVPCRTPGEMLGMMLVVHRRPHPWTVRELGLATGFAGQLATAMQNARLYSSVRALANRLTVIHELSLRLARLRDENAIHGAIVAEVARLVECDSVRVYRPDPDGAYRVVAASARGEAPEAAAESDATRGSYAETLPAWVAKRNEALVVPDASVERGSIRRLTAGPESVLLVPMAYADDVLGVLVVSRGGANRYGPDDEQALSIFARYAGQALVNAANIDRLERQQATLEQQLSGERRLLDISEHLVSTLDPRQVLEEIADSIGTVVRYDRLTVYRHDQGSGRIEPVVSRPLPEDGTPIDPEIRSLDEGVTSWVVGRGDAVCANGISGGSVSTALAPGWQGGGHAAGVDSAAATPAHPDSALAETAAASDGDIANSDAQNLIVVPLRVHGEVVGSLNLARVGGARATFTEPEFELCKLFASQASIALQNAETHRTIATRADLDSLTGLRNHGTFQRDLDALIEAGDPFSLLMMDLDSFKAYNDTFGHPAGDELLRTVSTAVVGATRQNDRAYRYGGDEFALLLVGPGSDHADDVARRIRAAVRTSVANVRPGADRLGLGVSIGAAKWPTDGPAKADLVAAADAALYEEKRNRPESR